MTTYRSQIGKAAGPKKDRLSQQGMEDTKSDKSQHPVILEKREQMHL